jgi:AcrR family transcriptional regulator
MGASDSSTQTSLGERKHQRTRQAIRDAALALFAERGFDAVTVTEIAHRAEVARSTFFRYFTDKQQVIFADDAAMQRLLADAVIEAAREMTPLGDRLPDALEAVRLGSLRLAEAKSRDVVDNPMLDKLLAFSPRLQECNLQRERGYTDAAERALIDMGADADTATLAARIGTACYAAGHDKTLDHPDSLPAAVDAAFQRLTSLLPR